MNCILQVAPLNLQENYDNSGLLIGEESTLVERALITLDVTEEVIDEAISKSCDLIVSHHPLIFKGLKRLGGRNPIERMVVKAIQNRISILSMHTNLDNSFSGVSRALADRLGLKNPLVLQPLCGRLQKLVVYVPCSAFEKVKSAMFEAGAGSVGNYDSCSFSMQGIGSFRAKEGAHPYVGEVGLQHLENEIRLETVVTDYQLNKVIASMVKAHPYEEVAYDVYRLDNSFAMAGSGMIGELEKELSEKDFLKRVQQVIGTPCLKHSAFADRKIKKVALCGGSGFFLLPDAKSFGADAFLTADIKYHDFFEADNKILLVDGGHFETEQFTKELLAGLILKKIPTFAVLIAETNTNSVHYFCKD
jgi:dinuclear metal center protein, YbgI/SA1388 family